ncbi:MAG: glycosyltransferase family 2 protein [Nitrospira sp.]|jgi:glycosyltransferase involved in cell wall biosynthesis
MKQRPHLSVVIPVYNERESVRLLCGKVRGACDPLGVPYELILVDDGSQDGTFEELVALHAQHDVVKVVKFRKNYGQTAAMAAGFRAARGRIVVSMDGDLQNDPVDIPRVMAKLDEGYDVVCGWRKDRKDKLISRKIPSKIANWLIGKITQVPIHDNGCSLKAYRADIIKNVALYSEMHRFIPAMSTLVGARITEIVVTHHARQFGKSKYGISRAWRVFLDLFLMKMLTGFAAQPALWFVMISLPTLLFGVVCMIPFLFLNATSVVWPAMGFLCFAVAGHFLSMGILGEMILETGDFQPGRLLAKSLGKIARGSHSTRERSYGVLNSSS